MAKKKGPKKQDDGSGRNVEIRIGPASAIHRGVVFVPTGVVALDHMIGGGVPAGKIIEVYGPYRSGKTLLGMEIVRGFQQAGGKAAWIDVEHAFDDKAAGRIGVNNDELDYTEDAQTVEAITDVVEDRLKTWAKVKQPRVVVVDSIAMAGTVHEMETPMEKRNLDRAGQIYRGFRRVIGPLAKSLTTLVIINQVRDRIGVFFGDPEVTPGGRSPEYAASLRLRIQQGTLVKGKKVRILNADGQAVGCHVIIRVTKNRIIPEGQQSEFQLLYRTGLDPIAGVLRLLAGNGLIDEFTTKSEDGEKGTDRFAYDGRAIKDAEAFIDAHPELLTKIWEAYRK